MNLKKCCKSSRRLQTKCSKKKKPRRPFRRVTVITLTRAGRVWLIMQLCLKERKIREPEQWSMTGLKLGSPYLYQVLQFTPTYQFKFFQWPKTVQSPSSQRLVIRKLRAKTNLSCRTDVKPWSFSITLCCCFLFGWDTLAFGVGVYNLRRFLRKDRVHVYFRFCTDTILCHSTRTTKHFH